MSLLDVLVGSSQRLTEDSTPFLVVEAEPARIEELRQSLAASPSPVEVILHQAVLAATPQLDVAWYVFSDPRFNGVVPLERWREHYPNLMLQHVEKISSQTLAEILADSPAFADEQEAISLIIRQGDPVEVLKGAAHWLHRFCRIEVQGPKVEWLWLEGCGRWLEEQGFCREPDSACVWTLDPHSAKLLLKTKEIDDLKNQLAQQTQLAQQIQQQQQEIEHNHQQLQQAQEAFDLIFPYAAYREKRPDLAHLSDPELVAHFMAHGRHEGVHLDHESLHHEWQQRSADLAHTAADLPLAEAGPTLAPSTSGTPSDPPNPLPMDPGPTTPTFLPIAGTSIQAWLVESRLFVSMPEALANTVSPAIYQGSEGYAMRRMEWSQEIQERLKGHQMHRLFSVDHRNHLKILSESQDPRILNAGINQIPDFSITDGQTLHVQLPAVEESCDLPVLVDFELTCESDEIWTFESLLACHRAQGIFTIRTTHQGKPKYFSVDFLTEKPGGRSSSCYQNVTFKLSLEKGTTYVSLSIQHGNSILESKDQLDCFYFVANPILRYCGTPDHQAQALEPRALRDDPDLDTTSCLYSSTVRPFFSDADPSLVLNLGNGICHELFPPRRDGVELIADHGHTLEIKAHLCGNYCLYINGLLCQWLDLPACATSVTLPLQWLRGEPVLVEIRDASGSQVHLCHSVITPRFLTPQDLLLYHTKAPFPSNLSLRFFRRYQSLRRHLEQPVEGLSFEMLLQALDTLEHNFQTLKLAPLSFPFVSDPEVSVIIPAFNHIEVTYYALCALLLAHNTVRFEILVVDDGSTDGTKKIEALVTGIRVIRNEKPLRFIQACNKGVSEAKGKFIVLLNNDTEVTSGWLDALVDAFQRFENVGVVGSKLLQPDGSLQDAGGMVWGSGNPWNYGHGQNPWDPRFCYARQVDYLSGAALMTTKSIWDQVGGFSSYLEPMYFEDTDFSFKVREAGYKTYFIPSSVVFHYEGSTSGTDLAEGFKKYQELNRPKFKQLWAKTFARHGDEGDQPDLEKDRAIKGRILFIDYATPREDRDAGSYAAIREMELVQSLGYKVTFLPTNLLYFGSYSDELMRNGVEVISSPFFPSLASFLAERAKEFDAVYVTRYAVAIEVVPFIREYAPKAKILLNNADLHFLRELRSAVVNRDEQKMAAMRQTREQELDVMRRVDVVLSYNEVEHAVITSHTEGQVKVMKCPWVVSLPAAIAPLSERKGISFLANFDHFPNAEGLKWFCREIMPILAANEIQFTIYGSSLNEEIKNLASEWIIPAGHIATVADAYEKHRVFVAPLLSGAGLKGKVLNALAYGVPTVLTPVAAEGIGLRDGLDCWLARDPQEWVTAILTLCREDDRWHALSTASRAYAASHFSFQQGRERIKEALEAVDLYNHRDLASQD